MPRIVRTASVIGAVLLLAAMIAGHPGSVAAGDETAPGVLPIGVPLNASTCGDPGDAPWPTGVTVIIPICGDSSGLSWLDLGAPGGGVAEVIAGVSSPIADLAVPDWIYAGEAFNPNNGNLEFALNEQAGTPLRLAIVDGTCIVDPGSGTDPCGGGGGSGSNLWVHAVALRTFTIESAHLTGDLTPCGTTRCLIGTFNSSPFIDVEDNPFRADIEWAFAAGITDGCGAELFCPKDGVHRDEMAAFLDRMFDLAPTDTDAFGDDQGNPHEDAINRVAAAGITLGCRAEAFCPDRTVSREQMAAFLARAAALADGAGRNYFSDEDGRPLEASDDLVAAAGISNGCRAYRFCPTASVLREQMVAFLHRVEAPIEPPPFPAP